MDNSDFYWENTARQYVNDRLRYAAEPHLTPRHPVRRRTARGLRGLADRLDRRIG